MQRAPQAELSRGASRSLGAERFEQRQGVQGAARRQQAEAFHQLPLVAMTEPAAPGRLEPPEQIVGGLLVAAEGQLHASYGFRPAAQVVEDGPQGGVDPASVGSQSQGRAGGFLGAGHVAVSMQALRQGQARLDPAPCSLAAQGGGIRVPPLRRFQPRRGSRRHWAGHGPARLRRAASSSGPSRDAQWSNRRRREPTAAGQSKGAAPR